MLKSQSSYLPLQQQGRRPPSEEVRRVAWVQPSEAQPPGVRVCSPPSAPLRVSTSQHGCWRTCLALPSWNQTDPRQKGVPRTEENRHRSQGVYFKGMQRDNTRIHLSMPPSDGKAGQMLSESPAGLPLPVNLIASYSITYKKNSAKSQEVYDQEQRPLPSISCIFLYRT